MSGRAILRKKLKDICKTEDELNEFICDYFPETYRNIGRSLSEKEKITKLFEDNDNLAIEDAMARFVDQEHPQLASEILYPTMDSSDLRRENIRLQQVIRDLERQLNGESSRPSISTSNGLQRLSELRTTIAELLAGHAAPPHQWTTVGHTILDGLECSLGKFHNISCDFRYLFSILKQPLSNDYLALLNAAEEILKQKVAEDARGSALYKSAMPQEPEPRI